MMCAAKRLNPFEGDAFLIGYDGAQGPKFSLITAHQAFLKRAEPHPEYDGMTSGIMVIRDGKMIDLEGDFHLEDDKIVGGWATVYFKNRSHPMHKKLRLTRFDTKLCKCAEADALRSSFPTLLGGLYTQEEMDRSEPEKKAVAPIFAPKGQPPHVEVEEVKPRNYIEEIAQLCVTTGVTKEEVEAFMDGIGIIPDGKTKLEDASTTNQLGIIANWADVSQRIIDGRKGE
jgi:phage recombination protein Bet